MFNTRTGPPSFTQDVYTTSVNESVPIGTQLTDLNIQATDPDVGDSLTYTIPPGEDITHFSIIQPSSALITVVQELDYETRPLYSFPILVADSGDNRDTANVMINIIDVNDNAPVFVQSVYEVLVVENTPVDSFLTAVSATDIDSATNGEITYHIIDGNGDGTFSIETVSGTITVAGYIDYELTASYSLIVQALDGGTPPLSATTAVIVTVVDENDNIPVCEQPSSAVSVPEDPPIGFPVVTVRATDVDSGANGEITFNIIGDDEDETFSINSTTGVVFVAQSLDREASPYHTLSVQAVDGGLNALTSTCTVIITVGNTTSATTEQSPLTSMVTDSALLHRQSWWCFFLLVSSLFLLLFTPSSMVIFPWLHLYS